MGITLVAALGAFSQTHTWTNGSGGTLNWSVNVNWLFSSAPPAGGGSGYYLIFSNSAGNATVANNDLAGTFSLSNLWLRSGALTLSGNPLQFTAASGGIPVLTNSTGARRVIQNDIMVGWPTWRIQAQNVWNGLRLEGGLDLGGQQRTLEVGGGNTPTMVTVVTNTGVVANGGLIKAGNGLLVLSGNNTYSLGTRVVAGTLQFDSAEAIGGSGANVTNVGGAVAFNFAGVQGVLTTRVGLISAGTIAIGPQSNNETIDFRAPLFTNAFLGAVGDGSLVGAIAASPVLFDHTKYVPYISVANGYPANEWRFGGGHGSLVITSQITGSDSVLIGGRGPYGVVVLVSNNTYNGLTRIQDGMHLWVSNGQFNASVISEQFGHSPSIVLSNGTLSIGNLTLTNQIVVWAGQANSQYNGAALRFVPGTTNLILTPIVAIAGFAAKVNSGSGTGVHIVAGGVIGTNQGVAFYDDASPNVIVITNKPVQLGPGGQLSGHNLIIAVSSNVASLLNCDWGGRWLIAVPNAFLGTPVLKLGTSGSTSINWFDLGGNDLSVSSFITTNQAAEQVYRHYIFSTNVAALRVANPTNFVQIHYEGGISGAVSLVKSGNNVLNLYGTNYSTAPLQIEEGAVGLRGPAFVKAPVVVNGGSIILTNVNQLAGSATLTVNAGGAVAYSHGLYQGFIDDVYTKMGGAAPTYALGTSTNAAIDFSDPFRPDLLNSFLGSAPGTNVFNGTVAWGNNNVRLGGGGGYLVYQPTIGSGTNLYVGRVGGDANSIVFLPTANTHDINIVRAGVLAVSNDSALGTVSGDLTETNIVLQGGSLVAMLADVQLDGNRRIAVGPVGGLGADAGRILYVPSEIFGTGQLWKVGSGTAVLTSWLNGWSGGTRLQEGVLNITNDVLGATGGPLEFNGGVLQISGNMTLRDRQISVLDRGGTIRVDTNRVLTITNSIIGAGRLVKDGMGYLWLTGSNTFSGGLVVSGGFQMNPNSRVYVSNAYSLGTGPIILTNGGQLFINSGTLIVTNALVHYGGDQSTGYSGALQLLNGSDVTWSGPMVVSNALTRVTVWNNSTLRLTGGVWGPFGVNFSAQSGSIIIENQPIVAAADLFYFSGGNNNLGTNYLNVTGNSFPSARIWQGGLLVLGVDNALPTNVTLTIGDPSFGTRGTLDLNGYNQTLGNLYSGTNFVTSFVTNRSSTLATLRVNQTVSTNWLGQFSGYMAFEKAGPADLQIHADQLHTGPTRVMAGVLSLVSNGALSATSVIQIDAGAELTATGRLDGALSLKSGQVLQGNGTFRGGLIVESGGMVRPGSSPGTLTVDGNVTFNSGSTFEAEILGELSGQYDQLMMNSTYQLTLNGATLSVWAPNPLTLGTVFPIISGWGSIDSSTFAGLPDGTTFLAGANQFQINYGTLPGYADDVTLTVVPEPGTLASMVLALAAGAMLRRRLRR
jgi:autotransporter-associated beta strand protein